MPINEVDVFTIVMGKTTEYYTKSLGNGDCNSIGITLPNALEEMGDIVQRVGEEAQPDYTHIESVYAKKVEQLALFVRESRSAYKRKVRGSPAAIQGADRPRLSPRG